MTPFPQLVPARIASLLERLRGEIWRDPQPVQIARARPTRQHVPWSVARRSRLVEAHPPFHWGRLFDSCWFRVRGLDRNGGSRWLRWRDQAEGVLYIGGKTSAGLDVAHRHAPLPPNCKEAWVQSVCCQSGIWHPDATGLDPDGSRFDGAETVRRDEDAWSACHDLLVLHELALEALKREDPAAVADIERPGVRPLIRGMSPRHRRLLRALDAAADSYERGGLRELGRALRAIYASLPAERDAIRATLVGHAHIDLVWLWPEHVGEIKTVHLFATVERLMKRYPEMRFTCSQPAGYEAAQRLEPELSRRVRNSIRAGRWEATGAMHVESDTLIACGEALLRSLQLGQEWFAQNCGARSRVLWLPDVFGYSACMPQLARLTGVEAFFTNKLTWNRITPFPYSSFVWRGPDGSEIVAHILQESRQYYNGTATLRELCDGAREHRQSDVHPEILVPTGYGDGGGGPTDEMCERARRLANLAEAPRASWGSAEGFFGRLRRRRSLLPVWTGEIYLEYHRGVYTTHGNLKDAFRRAERGMQSWEAAHCATRRGPVDPRAWRRLVFAQFHDAITGSSIGEVYAQMVPELESMADRALGAAASALPRGRSRADSLFNPLPMERFVCHRPRKGAPSLVYLPPLSGRPVGTSSGITPAPVRVDELGIENGIVSAEFDPNGEIASLQVRGRQVELAGPAASLRSFPDHPHAYDAWELDRHTLDLGNPLHQPEEVTVRKEGALAASVAFARRSPGGSRVTVRYDLEAGGSVLRITCDIDWREPKTLLKAIFPTRYHGRMARFGAPYGSVLREQWRGALAAEAQWEVPGSRWALVSDDAETDGLMLITESRWGFGCREGILDLSLLRSATVTGESGRHGRIVPAALRRGPRTAMYSDLGRSVVRFAVGHWSADAPRGEMPAALADALFTQSIPYRGPAISAGLLGIDGGDSLVAAWAKPLPGRRWLLRLHETMGRRGWAQLVLEEGWRIRRCSVLDRVGPVAANRIEFKPYEILGVVLEKAGAGNSRR